MCVLTHAVRRLPVSRHELAGRDALRCSSNRAGTHRAAPQTVPFPAHVTPNGGRKAIALACRTRVLAQVVRRLRVSQHELLGRDALRRCSNRAAPLFEPRWHAPLSAPNRSLARPRDAKWRPNHGLSQVRMRTQKKV